MNRDAVRFRKLIKEFVEEVRLQEVELNEMSAAGLKKTNFEEIKKKFPRFANILQNKFDQKELSTSSFAFQSGGMLGLGSKIPLMVTKDYNDPVIIWQDDNIKYNGSITLADAVRNAT